MDALDKRPFGFTTRLWCFGLEDMPNLLRAGPSKDRIKHLVAADFIPLLCAKDKIEGYESATSHPMFAVAGFEWT